MEIRGILADWTAVSFWRDRRLSLGDVSLSYRELRDCTSHARTFLSRGRKPTVPEGCAILESSDLPLRTIVGSKAARVSRKTIAARVCATVPDRSMVNAGDGLLVPRPEYCFMQMALVLSLVDLTVLGYELCGTYVVVPGRPTAYGKPPLTSTAKLREFLEGANGRGKHAALRAVSLVQDGSASPMETMLSMMLCLPFRLGGFGLPRPELNYPIAVEAGVCRRFRYADVCWPESRLVCEYDSDEFHPGGQQTRDLQRRNELRLAGYSVVEVQKDQVLYLTRFVGLAKALARALGKRLRLPPDFDAKHVGLRAQLLGSRRNPRLL